MLTNIELTHHYCTRKRFSEQVRGLWCKERADFRQQQQHYLQQYLSSASGMGKTISPMKGKESPLATEPRGDTPQRGILVRVQMPAMAYDSITHRMFLNSGKFQP